MEDQKSIEDGSKEEKTFKGYAAKRIVVGLLLTLVGLWIFGSVIGFCDKSSPTRHAATAPSQTAEKPHAPAPSHAAPATQPHATPAAPQQDQKPAAARTAGPGAHGSAGSQVAAGAHGSAGSQAVAGAHGSAGSQAVAGAHGSAGSQVAAAPAGHGTAGAGHGGVPFGDAPRPTGVAFVAATIRPMAFELEERFYGWRPNDILDFTDNVNNFQLGILEVTRRTAVNLAERISRTGSTDAFDPNLENAMNWFMIKATRYWFPSPESKYAAGLDELARYMENLKKGRATFHNRTDNLIPLLTAFEDLLGSCDENLAKFKEEDGSDVSFFRADNYFFYAKGVASAMHTILEAVAEDFQEVVNSRRGAELLHHAVVSLHHATEIDPWLITNADLSGVLANHRANMAAPISHARFYIGALIKTLST